MLVFVVAIAAFTLIIMSLVMIILAARAQLVPAGDVKLTVNDEKTLDVGVGGKLLGALINNQIFLSAACVGKGSCGQCRCKVLE